MTCRSISVRYGLMCFNTSFVRQGNVCHVGTQSVCHSLVCLNASFVHPGNVCQSGTSHSSYSYLDPAYPQKVGDCNKYLGALFEVEDNNFYWTLRGLYNPSSEIMFHGSVHLRGDVKIHWLQPPYSAASCGQLV